MPDAPPRPCAGGCGALVRRGRCPDCARQQDRRRLSAADRGYDRAWRAFRLQFLAALVHAGIVPVCGAALPGGPAKRESECKDGGLLTYASLDGSALHLDHEPELEDAERADVSRVCDPNRIVLKCAECHNAKTARALRRSQTGGDGKS